MDNKPVFEREIAEVWEVKPQQKSDIHNVGLVLEPGNWEKYDPFLLMAEDWFQRGVFDVHPHRGIETVTYVIEGNLEHYDNKTGSGDTLGPGDVQWMTAGKGVIHLENPAEGQTVHSLQLWINLPSSYKMTEPRYQNLLATNMPVRNIEGGTVRVFSGESGHIQSETKNYVPVTMVEINLKAGFSFTQQLPGSYNGFLYILEGSGTFGVNKIEADKSNVLWLQKGVEETQSNITINAEQDLCVLLYAGEPVNEPVVAYGPFVMNTQEEIKQAINDYQNGKFV